jgi:hypothetical protein
MTLVKCCEKSVCRLGLEPTRLGDKPLLLQVDLQPPDYPYSATRGESLQSSVVKRVFVGLDLNPLASATNLCYFR